MLRFSIIIPTTGKRKTLINLIETLQKQDQKGECEIIIAIDHQPNAQIKRLQKKQNVKIVESTQQGPSHNRNAGLLVATTKQIVFLDDDVVIPNHYFAMIEKAWREHPDATLIGGKITLSKNDLLKIPQSWLDSLPWIFIYFDWGNVAKRLKLGDALYSAHLLYRPTQINQILFNTQVGTIVGNHLVGGEDYEISQRLLLQKKSLWYEPTLSVEHNGQRTFSFWYVLHRQFWAGFETAMAEKVLIAKYSVFKNYVFSRHFEEDIFEKNTLTVKLFKLAFVTGYYYQKLSRSGFFS